MGIWASEAARSAFADALAAACPLVAGESLSFLGEGYGCVAYRSESGLALLAAKNDFGLRSRQVTTHLPPLIAS